MSNKYLIIYKWTQIIELLKSNHLYAFYVEKLTNIIKSTYHLDWIFKAGRAI